eukprot:Clim_evm36s251 gene=Clim_evmTU36s251
MKIIDKINAAKESGDPFFSLEFFPPRTTNGAINLVDRFDRMARGRPLFIDITWGAGGGDPSGSQSTSSMSIASTAINYCGLDTLLHYTCADSDAEQVTKHMEQARQSGIQNILALRGDPPPGEEFKAHKGGFSYATELIAHVKQKFGNEFCICAAGYPNGHPDCVSYEEDLRYLKMKVDAGADFIITQLFFETETFLKFREDCRNMGITVPIIPGVLPIQGYASLRHLTKLSKLNPPNEIVEAVEAVKDNDEAVRAYGVQLASKMIKELLDAGVEGVHMYTLNREIATREILKNVGLWKETSTPRALPWRSSASTRRSSEDVRPIFWSSRPKSYLNRTQDWDDFPNGRWGNSDSPAFGDLTDYHIFQLDSKCADNKHLQAQWGSELKSEQDVYDVFCKYLSNDNTVKCLPWSDGDDGPLHLETEAIKDQLININRHGILTINSQPPINGVKSDHHIYGWGGPNGYVYQKAYMEFFISKEMFELLLVILKEFPNLSYHAIDAKGQEEITNISERTATAVTWGVFPGKEIIQPTVVDPVSFMVWKDEAFALWNRWSKLYEPDTHSRKMIDRIRDSWYLVNVVDNDYINGNLFAVFDRLFEESSTRAPAS